MGVKEFSVCVYQEGFRTQQNATVSVESCEISLKGLLYSTEYNIRNMCFSTSVMT